MTRVYGHSEIHKWLQSSIMKELESKNDISKLNKLPWYKLHVPLRYRTHRLIVHNDI